MKYIFSVALIAWSFCGMAQLRTAAVFSDHMVLQRNAAIPVWGWGTKGEKIAVTFHDQTRQTVCGSNGKWMLNLDKEAAGGPYTLTVKGKKSAVTFKDVLVGEVWLCSGQSNMEWPLNATINADKEIAAATNDQLRQIKIDHAVSVVPEDDCKTNGWEVCNAATAGNFTAVGYYFAKELQRELKVPVGLINSSWGGTIVETWISKTALQAHPEFTAVAQQLPANKEEFEKGQLESIRKNVAAFQYIDAAETPEEWNKTEYNDSRWSNLKAPLGWEEQGLNGLDGTVWYRKTITVSAADAAKDAVLWLGRIDDCDVTFVNGKKVGETCVYDRVRKYTLPAGSLKEGKNVIAIRVLDTGGGGGLWGDAADVKLETASGVSSLAGQWKARVDVKASIVAVSPNAMPTLLYNTMIHPLLPYAIKGAIWYQGESNAEWAQQYTQSFPLLIKDWRSKFGQGDFPFYFVQLASFNANNQNSTNGSKWAELRAAQLQTLQLPHTGMAVTTDIGDAKDIHPRNKLDVGKRLSLWALKNDYGKDITVSGPLYQSMETVNGQIKLTFTSSTGGLKAAGNKYGYLQGFMIAGKDQQFKWAKAWIKDNTVIVWCEEVAEPVAVRYGWTDDNGEANLVNGVGLPAAPFRTDNWKLLTDGIKYFIGK